MLILPTSCDKEMKKKCTSEKKIHNITIASVGYDQRLAIWRPTSTLLSADQILRTQVTINHFNFSQEIEDWKNNSDENDVNVFGEHHEEVSFSSLAGIVITRDALLLWITGATIHVGDVCALDAMLTCSNNFRMKSSSRVNIPDSICQEKCKSDMSAGKVGHVDTRDGNKSDVDIIVVGEGFQLLSFHM